MTARQTRASGGRTGASGGRRRMAVIVVVAALCGGAPIAATQETDQSAARDLDALVRDATISLSLEDAIAIALSRNLDVHLLDLGRALADSDLRRAEAGGVPRGVPLGIREGPRSASGTPDLLFPSVGFGTEANLAIGSPTSGGGRLPPSRDPVLLANVRRTELEQPQPNSFSSGASVLETRTTTATASVQQGFVTGGELTVTFDNTFSQTNNRRFDLNPFANTGISAGVVQPLLRGFGPAVNRRYLRVAQNNRKVSDLVFQQQVVTTVATVVRLYWDLVSLTEDVKVRLQALERAERLLADTEVHADVGTRASIDVVRARAEVARSRRDLIASEGLVRQQEVVLKDYLSADAAAAARVAAARVVPSDALPPVPPRPAASADVLVTAALEARPDLAQARLQLDNSRWLLKGSQNGRLPVLDAVALVRSNGLGGTLNPLTVPGAVPHTAVPALIGSYGTALDQMVRGEALDYVVGLQMTVPLRNRAANADYARDQIVVRQQELRVQQIEKQVRVEIEYALVALAQAEASVDAAREERTFQEQALAAEQDRLGVGASTTYLVIQYQRDLTQARSAEVAALAAAAKAQAALACSTGQLLTTYGVSVDKSQTQP